MFFSGKEYQTLDKKNFVGDLVERDVVCVAQDASIIDAAKLMREHHIGDVVVINDDNEPVGIITDRDVVVETLAQSVEAEDLCVGDIMSSSITCAKEEDGIYDIIRLMKENGVARVPIINTQGTLVGIITAKKILQLLVNELNDLVVVSEQQKQKEVELRH